MSPRPGATPERLVEELARATMRELADLRLEMRTRLRDLDDRVSDVEADVAIHDHTDDEAPS